MSYASVHLDPATVNDENPTATLGALYSWAGAPADSSAAPPGVYRYAQAADLATINGDVMCPDVETGISMQVLSKDRSADVVSTICGGIAVSIITAAYHGYFLVRGRHQAIVTDGSITAGLPLMPHATGDGQADARAETDATATFGTSLEADSSAAIVSADVNCL